MVVVVIMEDEVVIVAGAVVVELKVVIGTVTVDDNVVLVGDATGVASVDREANVNISVLVVVSVS